MMKYLNKKIIQLLRAKKKELVYSFIYRPENVLEKPECINVDIGYKFASVDGCMNKRWLKNVSKSLLKNK